MLYEVITCTARRSRTRTGWCSRSRITSYNVCYTKLLRVQGAGVARAVAHENHVARDDARALVITSYSIHYTKLYDSDIEGFLDRERERYAEQLQRYSTHLGNARMGLYFPLLRGWREWGPDDVVR